MRYGRREHRQARPFNTRVGGNSVTLLHDGEECLPAMRDAIADAEHEICLEMYWFGSDATGRRFAELLEERARAGVDVRVIYDAVGSFEADPAMFQSMRAAGCAVSEFNPISPFRQRFNLGVVNNRDHRKVLVVDGRIGFTGGVNIGDPWASRDEGGLGWRDDMIRVDGPAAAKMREVFLHTWEQLRTSPLAQKNEAYSRDVPTPPWRPGSAPVRILADHTFGERRVIRSVYLDQIAKARRSICITNSYFVPDRVVRRALSDAVRRGARVRVLVPGESDVPAVFHAGRSLYAQLMRDGIELYEWQDTVLHAKSAAIDGRWCTIGSYNLDYRSWRFNLEIAVEVEDARVARAVEERFEKDLLSSVRIDWREWDVRPLSTRGIEQFFRLFRKLL